ncbi:YadA-like family protein [Haemophilus influenzae]|uniref:Autotransporter adhesin EhaG n=1 Tax=Haemophilus influenzae TaxID=727 RepID=A0AAX3IP71_HAEIF|nr:YadA-like family protein [Haemophilus influenzae]VTX48460.1 Autotransporter adhesin EhaG [Haemophilus influenzae]
MPGDGGYNVAIGDGSKVTNSTESGAKPSIGAVAIGGDTHVKSIGSLAIGYGAKSGSDGQKGKFSTAIGINSNSEKGGVAVGHYAEAFAYRSIAIGSLSTSKDGDYSIAFGVHSLVEKLEKGKNNNKIGKNIDVNVSGTMTKIDMAHDSEKNLIDKYGQTYGAMALGFKSSSRNLFASSFGAFSTATAIESLAVGDSSQSTGYCSATFGSHSRALAEESLALGYETRANAYGSVALGAESVANEENTVSVGSDTLKRKIVNVADGTEDYDAVNVRQLNAVEAKIGQVNNQFTQVDTRLNQTDLRINCVGASAAALASLKPAQLGEDDKFALSLGVGSYKNTQAMAMGAVFKPVENVLLNVAGSFSGSEKTFGAGVSWKFGNKSKPAVSTQSAVNSAEVLQLRQEVSAMQKELAELKKALRK